MALDGLESVMASEAPTFLQSDSFEGELKIVMDNKDILALEIEEVGT